MHMVKVARNFEEGKSKKTLSPQVTMLRPDAGFEKAVSTSY